jgi:hypothetical protein
VATEHVPLDFERFLAAERRAQGLTATRQPLPPGGVGQPLTINTELASRLSIEAAKRAAGFFRPTRRGETVWVDGENELAVGIGGVHLQTASGVVVVTIPVRCDQTGPTEVHVTFAVGRSGRPAGLYAAAQRRPRGPQLIVDTWGDALVAFAWQVLLELVSGLAAATGKDARGNHLIPVELEASAQGLRIVPMARYHFVGSLGLGGST